PGYAIGLILCVGRRPPHLSERINSVNDQLGSQSILPRPIFQLCDCGIFPVHASLEQHNFKDREALILRLTLFNESNDLIPTLRLFIVINQIEPLVDDLFATEKPNLHRVLNPVFILLAQSIDVFLGYSVRRLTRKRRVRARSPLAAERPPAAGTAEASTSRAKRPEVDQEAERDHPQAANRVECRRLSFAS